MRVAKGVTQGYLIIGDADFIQILAGEDVEALDVFVKTKLYTNPNVRRFKSMIALDLEPMECMIAGIRRARMLGCLRFVVPLILETFAQPRLRTSTCSIRWHLHEDHPIVGAPERPDAGRAQFRAWSGLNHTPRRANPPPSAIGVPSARQHAAPVMVPSPSN
ncbi:Lrp/AsnC ligand binding domain-containing protein [Mesorhizobium sp. M0751]